MSHDNRHIKARHTSLCEQIQISTGRVFPSGGGGGLGGTLPMSSMSPLITAVSPPSLLIMTKISSDIFLIFA